jgi:hypothetical protein
MNADGKVGSWRLSQNETGCAALPDDGFTRSASVILLGSFCRLWEGPRPLRLPVNDRRIGSLAFPPRTEYDSRPFL